jgi:hypothetical protein
MIMGRLIIPTAVCVKTERVVVVDSRAARDWLTNCSSKRAEKTVLHAHPWEGGETNMNLKKKFAALLLVLALAPAYVIAQDMEFKGTIVSKEEKSIKVKTKDGEKMLSIGSTTKGVENATDGAKVTIKYTEKDGQLRASEINPR